MRRVLFYDSFERAEESGLGAFSIPPNSSRVSSVDRDDLLRREAEAWAEFSAAVANVPADRREDPVLPDDWSVKDVLWHVVFWWEDGCATFEQMASGIFETYDGDTDVTNARVLEESRSMYLTEVEAAVEPARDRLIAAYLRVPRDQRADDDFIAETIEHYEEHMAAVLGFAG